MINISKSLNDLERDYLLQKNSLSQSPLANRDLEMNWLCELLYPSTITRNFTRLIPSAQQYYEIGSLDLGDNYELEISWSTLNTSNQVLLGDSHLTTYYLNFATTIGWWSGGTAYAFSVGGINMQDGQLHTLRIISTQTTLRMILDGVELARSNAGSWSPYNGVVDNVRVGSSNSNPVMFDGYIANLRIWTGGDRTSGELYQQFLLDETFEEDNIIRSTTASLGPEIITNGTFEVNTNGWQSLRDAVLSVDNGQLVVENGPTGFGGAVQPITLEIGEQYEVSADYTHVDGSGFLMVSANFNLGEPRMLDVEVATSTKNFTQVFTATHSTAYLGVAQGSTAAQGTQSKFDNITLKKISGGSHGTAINITSDSSRSFTYSDSEEAWIGDQELENNSFETLSGWFYGNQVTYNSVNQTMNWSNAANTPNDRVLYRVHTRPLKYRVTFDGDISTGAIGIYNGTDYIDKWVPGGPSVLDVENVNTNYGFFIIRADEGTTATLRSIDVQAVLEVAQ